MDTNNTSVVPEKPTLPTQSDSIIILVNKVKEVNVYTDHLKTELAKSTNHIVDLIY